MSLKKGGLGKGLDIIFMENDTEDRNSTVKLKITEIEPNREQPRSDFDETALAELADSISEHGLLQPLLVRPLSGGGYQIVAGERRWRACRMAGVKEIPAIIRELGDSEVMQLALIENLQREDLSVIEEAKGYKALIEKYDFTQDEVSKSVGKSRPVITNALRILNLPESVLQMVSNGSISSGHARTLLSFDREEDIIKTAELIIEKQISVRELENIVKRANDLFAKGEEVKVEKKRITFFDEVELALKEHMGRKVSVLCKNDNKGILKIEFFSKEDLADIAKTLGNQFSI